MKSWLKIMTQENTNTSLAREKSLAKKNPLSTSTYKEVNNQSSSLTVSSTTHLVDSIDLEVEVDQHKHQFYKKGKYDDIDFSIPKGVKRQAERGLGWVGEYRRGGTSVGRGTARYLINNTKASPQKVRHIARYFPRHEGDLNSPDARSGKITNGVIAWALWGGNAGRRWSEKLVRAMNKRDEKAETAEELLRRYHLLKLQETEYIENRFESVEVKQSIYKNYEALIKNWNAWLTNYYVNLLRNQNKKIVEILGRAKNSSAQKNSFLRTGSLYQLDNYIDESTQEWALDVYDIYTSVITDFTLFQLGLLLPESFKGISEVEQVGIFKARRKTKRQVINEGFYPIRAGGQVVTPYTPVTRNRDAIAYLNNRFDTIFPDMAKTTKANLNRAIRRGLDTGRELGLTGDALFDYVNAEVTDTLPKKHLKRASTIARTEAQSLGQFGQYNLVKETGIPVVKEWICSFVRSRDTHIRADGQEVGRDEDFRVGGYPASYPADPRLPVAEVANCNCNVIYKTRRL